MPISERASAAVKAAKRRPKHHLREFVAHFLNVQGIGPQPCASRFAEHMVRHGWIEPSGKLKADGRIVGKAFMLGGLQ